MFHSPLDHSKATHEQQTPHTHLALSLHQDTKTSSQKPVRVFGHDRAAPRHRMGYLCDRHSIIHLPWRGNLSRAGLADQVAGRNIVPRTLWCQAAVWKKWHFSRSSKDISVLLAHHYVNHYLPLGETYKCPICSS